MSNEDQSLISSKLEHLSDQNKRILAILENDERIGHVGLVQSVSVMRAELDAIVHAYKTYKAVKRRENMIWGSVGATALMLIKWLGSALFPFLSKL